MPDEYLIIGQITGTFGVRGEVKVFPLTDDPERFRKLKEVFLTDNAGNISGKLECLGSKTVKNMVILSFKSITDMDLAMAIKGKYISVNRKNAVKLPENSYFICDLTGLDVVNTQGETVGILSDVISTGANDVYVIKRQGRKDLLIPAVKEVVKSVDLENKRITVELIPGLEDIYE